MCHELTKLPTLLHLLLLALKCWSDISNRCGAENLVLPVAVGMAVSIAQAEMSWLGRWDSPWGSNKLVNQLVWYNLV